MMFLPSRSLWGISGAAGILLAAAASFGTAEAFAPTVSVRLNPVGSSRRSSTGLAASVPLADTDEERIASMPLPPNNGMNVFRNIRDTLSYLSDPDAFVAKRSAKLGDVFLAYTYFMPTVFVGGQEAVRHFITHTERSARVTHSALPDIFTELHTHWGALNLDIDDPRFLQARSLFADVLSGSDAMERFTASIEGVVERYVSDLEKRVREDPEGVVYLAPELKSLCLQIFSLIFSGEGLSDEQEQMFIDYNRALMSLSRRSKQYKRGKTALETLKNEMIRRFCKLDDPAIPRDAHGKWFHDQVRGREGFEDDDRIGTVIVLFTWGAYIECASLMSNSVALMTKHSENSGHGAALDIRAELRRRREETDADPSEFRFWSGMHHVRGILRETLRVEPPGAGLPKFSESDFEFYGYRIPAKTAVMLDPRIGNRDERLYPDPERFEPLRWSPKAADDTDINGREGGGGDGTANSGCPFLGTALNRGPGSWFPGGNGAHRCPGLPLAELAGKMFVAKIAERFESWDFAGDGLTKKGEIDYVRIPVKIPPDNFGIKFRLAEESSDTHV